MHTVNTVNAVNAYGKPKIKGPSLYKFCELFCSKLEKK